MKSNELKYYLRGIAGIFAGLGACGGVLTAYYAELGFTNSQIASFSTIGSIMQVLVYVGSIFLADRFQKIKEWIAWLSLSSVLPCLALLPFCMPEAVMDTASAYPLYLAATCINNLMAGLAGLLMYRLPYLIIDMKDFARLENINSIVSNVFSIASKAVLTFFTALFTLRQIMHAGMLIGILFSVLYTVLVLSMKIDSSTEDTGSSSIPSGAGISTRSSFSLEKLQKKEISYFHLPNFLRGISSGAMTLIAVVCMNEISSDATILSALTTLMAVSTILASLVYQALRKKITTVKLYLASSVVMCIFLTLMLVGNHVIIFFCCFFLAYIGYIIISTAGAVYATEIVGYHDIGTYTALRLIAIMGGTALASQTIAIAMDYIPAILIMTICGLCQLISGIMFYRFDVRYR